MAVEDYSDNRSPREAISAYLEEAKARYQANPCQHGLENVQKWQEKMDKLVYAEQNQPDKMGNSCRKTEGRFSEKTIEHRRNVGMEFGECPESYPTPGRK